MSKVLAREGAIPIIVGRSEEDNQKALDKIGGKGMQVVAELTRPEDCQRAVKAVLATYGRIEGLVNNAGVNDGVGLEHGSYEAFIASLHKKPGALLPHGPSCIARTKSITRRIVNISSKTADTGQGNTSAYAASNGGRNALTREWAVELLPYGIRVNAIVVAECYTPLYDTWIKTLPDPEGTLATHHRTYTTLG